jgi:hypothetical protein
MSLSHGKPGLASLLFLAILLLMVSPSQARVITESFDNDQFNQDLFAINVTGTGPSAAVVNGHLEITLPSDSTIDPSREHYGCYLHTQFLVTGDYEVQVDFDLQTWPTNNGGAGILTDSNCEVSRRYFGSEVYEAWLNGVEFRVDTSDRTGTLRLKKTGNTVEASYRKGADWVPIGSSTDPQFGLQTGIAIGSFNFPNPPVFPAQNLKVAFDNLKITYATFSPPILQLLLD